MQNEQKSPMMNQPDNKPMSYGGSVMPANAKGSPSHTPAPVGKTSAPYQAGHGSGVSTDAKQNSSRTAGQNLG